MIETRFYVKVNIDGIIFDITVGELKPAEKKLIEEIGKKHREIMDAQSVKEKKIEENMIAMEESQRIIDTNKEMLELVELKDKLLLYVEMKKEWLNIAKLKRERMNLERSDYSKADETLENMFKERFKFLVSGEHADELRKMIDEKGISYQIVFNDINKEIMEQMKKK